MNEETKTRTQEQIADLKAQWLEDPVWDIEKTEGFNDHHDELKAWRLETETGWEQRDQDHHDELKAWRLETETSSAQQTLAYARTAGCAGNLKMAATLQSMLREIRQLEERIERLENLPKPPPGRFQLEWRGAELVNWTEAP